MAGRGSVVGEKNVDTHTRFCYKKDNSAMRNFLMPGPVELCRPYGRKSMVHP